ncbi:hypothetical protein SAMN04488113_12916 [Alkalibacterium gilvum]|uniref:Short C-terminal domain-containing protein n=1 Tax=Alkalibacterium gilvum TaxID=1130080 RepID=A0A1H6ULP6_9LACT|nr:hypothetical protein [Alkalibacterium gilvum]SEI88792.1 hypothetical protein SAMN04488113_12916 [Alkalibacterium gilvum]
MKLNQFKLKKESQIEKIRDVAEDWKSTLDVIIKKEEKQTTNVAKDNADDNVSDNIKISDDISNEKTKDSKEKIELLRDLKELYDSESITEKEYDKLKNEILNS